MNITLHIERRRFNRVKGASSMKRVKLLKQNNYSCGTLSQEEMLNETERVHAEWGPLMKVWRHNHICLDRNPIC